MNPPQLHEEDEAGFLQRVWMTQWLSLKNIRVPLLLAGGDFWC